MTFLKRTLSYFIFGVRQEWVKLVKGPIRQGLGAGIGGASLQGARYKLVKVKGRPKASHQK